MEKKLMLIGLLFLVVLSCRKNSKIEGEIAEIPIQFNVERFDRLFAQAEPQDLPALKEKYPFLFPAQYSDEDWIALMTDTIQLELQEEVQKAFPDLTSLKEDIRHLFQHLAYYFPDFDPPRIITVISQVDYHHKIVLQDGLLLISLDTYLGENHHFYGSIQRYYSKNFRKNQILPDIAESFAKQLVPRPEGRSFLDYMVYYGKIQYFKSLMLPGYTPEEIMGYTSEEWKWAEENERYIWGFFIEENILYETNPELRRRFFDLGPFTKFGLDLDHESPSEIGQYIGWKIVERFVEKNSKISLNELVQFENEKLFKESNYKPKQQ